MDIGRQPGRRMLTWELSSDTSLGIRFWIGDLPNGICSFSLFYGGIVPFYFYFIMFKILILFF